MTRNALRTLALLLLVIVPVELFVVFLFTDIATLLVAAEVLGAASTLLLLWTALFTWAQRLHHGRELADFLRRAADLDVRTVHVRPGMVSTPDPLPWQREQTDALEAFARRLRADLDRAEQKRAS